MIDLFKGIFTHNAHLDHKHYTGKRQKYQIQEPNFTAYFLVNKALGLNILFNNVLLKFHSETPKTIC